MGALPIRLQQYIDNIHRSGLSIYDPIPVGDKHLWIPGSLLEEILNSTIPGLKLTGLPIRTRSKIVKAAVCAALGYPVPSSFRKTRPRFPGQQFDTYAQKANNLQIWNEELAPMRRYVLLGIDQNDTVTKVRVVTGQTLAKLDTTGTLTKKYQARAMFGDAPYELVTPEDTDALRLAGLAEPATTHFAARPTADPDTQSLLAIGEIGRRLTDLIGRAFPDLGADQERNRGADLHKLVCEALGYPHHGDNGQFPDIPHQLLEVKLQTSPTVDLGIIAPDSSAPADMPPLGTTKIRHCDIRYAVFGASSADSRITLTHLILTTGEQFYSRFAAFGGNVLNTKLQIRLPRNLFT